MKHYRTSVFAVGPGHRTPNTLLLLDERDRYLREAARLHCIGMSNHQASDFLSSRLARYRGSGWRRDASEATCPVRLKGRVEACCWLILKSRDAVPGDRTVRDVLARA